MARPAPTNCENVAADHVAPIKNQAFTETGLEHFSTQILYGLYNTAQHPIAILYHLWHTGEQGVRDYQRDNRYQRGQVWGAGLFGLGSFVVSDGLLDGDVLAGGAESSAAGVLSRAEQDALKARIRANPGSAVTSNFGVHAAVEKVPHLDIDTDLDQATFWSGYGNRDLAEKFASVALKRTIEMTPGGKYLESLKLFDRFPGKQAIIPWERLSLRFAQSASGEVSAFVEGARAEGVFRRIEYPALIENPDVTNIVYSPSYEKTNIFQP